MCTAAAAATLALIAHSIVLSALAALLPHTNTPTLRDHHHTLPSIHITMAFCAMGWCQPPQQPYYPPLPYYGAPPPAPPPWYGAAGGYGMPGLPGAPGGGGGGGGGGVRGGAEVTVSFLGFLLALVLLIRPDLIPRVSAARAQSA